MCRGRLGQVFALVNLTVFGCTALSAALTGPFADGRLPGMAFRPGGAGGTACGLLASRCALEVAGIIPSMDNEEALGGGYWVFVGLFVLLCAIFSYVACTQSDWTKMWISASGALWMAFTAVWGRRRVRELDSLEPDSRRRSLEWTGKICRGSLRLAFVLLVLISFFLPAFRITSAKAARDGVLSDIRAAARALNFYKARTGAYPDLQGGPLEAPGPDRGSSEGVRRSLRAHPTRPFPPGFHLRTFPGFGS